MTQASKQALPLPGPTPASRTSEPQKGWLYRWTRKQWCRHWFVLNSGSLTYYRKPEFEHYSFLDGVLDMSLISRIEVAPEPAPASAHAAHHHAHHLHNNSHHLQHLNKHHQQQQQHHHYQQLPQQQQYQQQQQQGNAHFAFSLRMWNGECHLLSAGSAAERALWLTAINECADNGCLEDDPATDSASSSDSSPTSNLSAKSIDAGEPLSQWRSTHRCDQLALDQLALSIKSAIRRRDQQNNHSLKFLSDLHSGSGGKLAASDSTNHNDNNNNSQHKDDAYRGEEKPKTAQEEPMLLADPKSHRLDPSSLATNEVHKSKPLSCWSPSQRSMQHQIDQPSQEVPTIQQQQKVALQEDDVQPSFKKRPLFAESIYHRDSPVSPPSGGHISLVPEPDEQADGTQIEKKSSQPQKKRVTFDLSLSLLYQLTSSSGSDESDNQEDEDADHQDSNDDHDDDDDLSDLGEESSLSPSSSLSSQCMSDTEENSSLHLKNESVSTSIKRNSPPPHPLRHDEECVDPTADGDTVECHEPEARYVERSLEAHEEATCRPLNYEMAPIQMQELKHQLEAAQEEVSSLQRQLSSSCDSYGQLELTCERLRDDLLVCEESQKQELLRLQARVEELTRDLASSQQELLEARRKLIKFKEQAQQGKSGAKERGAPNASSGPRYQSWLRLQQQVGASHQPLLLMHHVKHTIAANQQLLGAKLLNHSKQIQRKLNQLELKVDRIQLDGNRARLVN